MRAVVQRVAGASVLVNGHVIGSIDRGVVVLLGIGRRDTEAETGWLAEKIIHLRIFEDEAGKMNRSLKDIDGDMLIVSQFTLFGDCRKGRRPGYSEAAAPETAKPLYESFIRRVDSAGIRTATGIFQETMQVSLINDGPVTLLIDSDKTF